MKTKPTSQTPYMVSSVSALILTAVVGGIIGWTARTVYAPSSGQMEYGIGGGPEAPTTYPSPFVSTLQMQYQLEGLMEDHVTRTADLLDKLYDGKDISDARKSVEDNSSQIADVVEKLYGQQPHDIFLTQWRQHISYYETYTNALKTHNADQATQAMAQLRDFAARSSSQLAQINPYLSQTTLEQGLNKHAAQMARIVELHSRGYKDAEQDAIKQGQDHAKEMADMLVEAIGRQFNGY